MEYKYVCPICGNSGVSHRPNRKYCSVECVSKAERAKMRKLRGYNSDPNISTMYTFDCLNCGKKNDATFPHQKFCSNNKKCSQEYWSNQTKEVRHNFNLNSGTIGAISELKVSFDLMLKGYEIFRALSPASSCDLIARKNSKEYTIEVRTGHFNLNGTIAYPTKNIRAQIVAIYIPKNNSVEYIPPIPS